MHTPKDYEDTQQELISEQSKLKDLELRKEQCKQKIKKIKKRQKQIVENTIGVLDYQKLNEKYIRENKEYWKMIERWKEKYKNDEQARLDQLTEHYRCIIDRLSTNRKHILYLLVNTGKPLSSKEIAESRIFYNENQITSKYISATLNLDGMYSIPKNKIYKFEIFEKNEDGKFFISSKDPDFYKFLKMRFLPNKEIKKINFEYIKDRELNLQKLLFIIKQLLNR